MLKNGDSLAEIVENFDKRVLKIRIAGNDRQDALAIIRKEVKELHDTFENLPVKEMVPCNCEECQQSEVPNFFEYKVLKQYKQEDVSFIDCTVGKIKKVNVLSLISDVITSQNFANEPLEEGSKKLPPEREKRKVERTKIFISYSHQDKDWLKRVQIHLTVLEHEDTKMDAWDDTKITAGQKWKQEIEKALSTAKIALLLITTDFLASDFIVKNELPPLLKAAEEDGAKVIPLIIKPSRFTRNENISQFQAINNPSKPLIKLREADKRKSLLN